MFGILPRPAFLTLDAALRDATAHDAAARVTGVSSLAPALLHALGDPEPLRASRPIGPGEHARAREVLAALERALADPSTHVRGVALTGMAQLAPERALALAIGALERADPEPFEVECAALSAAVVARSAGASSALVEQATAWLRALLDARWPEARYHAGIGLVELGAPDALPSLAARLVDEPDREVCDGWLHAVLEHTSPSPALLDAVERRLQLDPSEPVGFTGARVLAAGGRPAAIGPLLAALADVHRRDDALEALAVIGPAAPDPRAVRAALTRLAWRPWIPGATQVRIAYALARVAPELGHARLARLGKALRPAIREAVADAHRALERLLDRELAAEPAPSDGATADPRGGRARAGPA